MTHFAGAGFRGLRLWERVCLTPGFTAVGRSSRASTGGRPRSGLQNVRAHGTPASFYEGNGPADKAPLAAVRRGCEALPPSVRTQRFRGDSAFYVHETLRWLMDLVHQIERLMVSADMCAELRALCVALEVYWKPLESRKHETVYWSKVA